MKGSGTGFWGSVWRRQRRWGWVAFGVALGALFVAERRRPFARQREPGVERVGTQPGDRPAGRRDDGCERDVRSWRRCRRLAERGRIGLLRQLPLPRALRVVLGFLLLDYTLYLWHWLNHRSPLLWRFHAVHHVDLRSRFDDRPCGFISASWRWRPAFAPLQVLLLGVDRETHCACGSRSLVVSVVSSITATWNCRSRSEALAERGRGHAADARHPSLDAAATRPTRTISSLLSMLGPAAPAACASTCRRAAVTIGVAGFSEPEDVTLERSLTLPFRGGSWRGCRLQRAQVSGARRERPRGGWIRPFGRMSLPDERGGVVRRRS